MPSRKRHRQTKQTAATLTVVTEDPIWSVTTPEAVPRLIDAIFDETRYRPLIVISTASDTHKPRIDVDALLAEVDDHVNLVVLGSGATTWAFTNSIPEALRAYGGGVRLYWPYATPADDRDRHPLFLTRTEDNSPRTIRRIVRALHDKGFLPEPATPDHRAPWETPHLEPVPERDKVERLLGDLAAANDRIAALGSENADLRKSVKGLTDQVEALQQRLHARNIYSDPAAQLRHEIEHAWLVTYNEADRETYPLATYTFGPDFLTSVETVEGVERDKVVAACVDVLTRRAWEVNGRQARQFRSSPAPGSPYLTRASDGSSAWRCNLQTSTASARRLMWWEVPDGTIELAVVAIHDNVEMR